MSKKQIGCMLLLWLALSALVAGAEQSYTGTINADKVLLRVKANADCDYVDRLMKGVKVTVFSQKGGYYKVSAKGKDGYVMIKFVNLSSSAKSKLASADQKANAKNENSKGGSKTTAPKTDPAMKGITKISQIKLPNTTKPGNSGTHVKALQQALKLKGYYKDLIDSDYGQKTKTAVTAYQKAVGLQADGVAGNSTIKKLFGQNAPNYTIPTEKLDWFNGGQNTIPKGAVFTVKDIESGKTFKARRWSGINHLDAEPLNKDAAAIVKSLAGNYSWARRAALVKYDGHVYAASINTMPHEDDTLPDNNFEGHFCIHFYKSKTHGTNKVDEVHQNAVAHAMNCQW